MNLSVKQNFLLKMLIAVAVLIAVALQYRLWFGPSSLPAYFDLQAQLQQQQQRNLALQQRNELLVKEIDYLKNNPEAYEELAREELGMIKPGEVFIQVQAQP